MNVLAQFRDVVDKIPFVPMLMFYLGYLGYGFYEFQNDENSPLKQKENELRTTQDNVTKLESRVKQTKEFLKNLEARRIEIRHLAQDLENTKATLSESLDVSLVMKIILTEAKRVGLNVTQITPGDQTRMENYAQQVISMSYRGAFVQMVAFLDRLASLQKIVRADNFSMRPMGDKSGRIPELEGQIQIKVYRYLSSKADELVKDGGGKK